MTRLLEYSNSPPCIITRCNMNYGQTVESDKNANYRYFCGSYCFLELCAQFHVTRTWMLFPRFDIKVCLFLSSTLTTVIIISLVSFFFLENEHHSLGWLKTTLLFTWGGDNIINSIYIDNINSPEYWAIIGMEATHTPPGCHWLTIFETYT